MSGLTVDWWVLAVVLVVAVAVAAGMAWRYGTRDPYPPPSDPDDDEPPDAT